MPIWKQGFKEKVSRRDKKEENIDNAMSRSVSKLYKKKVQKQVEAKSKEPDPVDLSSSEDEESLFKEGLGAKDKGNGKV